MDPTLRTRTITSLKKIIPDLSPRLGAAAKYIVDNASDFGLDPIRETARKAGVSTYSLVRLAEKLGFDGYDELREPFRHALVSASAVVDQPDWVSQLRENGKLGQEQADAAINTMAIVQRSLERQSQEQMERVVQILLEANNIYLTAVRASYAFAYYLHYVGRMALPSLQLIPRHMNSPIDELSTVGEGDVMIAISFSPYSRETIEACKYAQSKGVRLIMISDSDVISSDFQTDETLVVSTVSTHHFACYAGVTAVIENLLALLVSKGGDQARSRIQSYEVIRKDHNAYWIAQKNRSY